MLFIAVSIYGVRGEFSESSSLILYVLSVRRRINEFTLSYDLELSRPLSPSKPQSYYV